MTQPPKTIESSLEPLIELYLLRCDVEGRSPRTVGAYRETLHRFIAVSRDEGFPDDVRRIEPSHLYCYLGHYTHHSPATRHRYFRELRCFFNWLSTLGYIDENPFRSLKNVRLPQRIVQPFSADEIGRLVAACDTDVPVGARDHAILMTLLDTGIRCSELVQLTIVDLDLEDGRLRILHAKGNKQRIVFVRPAMPRGARAALGIPRHRTRTALPDVQAARSAPPWRCAAAERPEADAPAAREADRASPRCMPTASDIRSRRGQSNRMRGNSTSSTCSNTHPQTWCAATRPPTTQNRPPAATSRSPLPNGLAPASRNAVFTETAPKSHRRF